MNIKDMITVQGSFKLWMYKNGILIEKVEEHNLIVQTAKTILASLVGGAASSNPVSQIAFGTNGTQPVSSDTQITDAYSKGFEGISYPTAGQVAFSWMLGADEANGMKIFEFGLLTGDGSLFARKTRSEALAKEADITVYGEWTISF